MMLASVIASSFEFETAQRNLFTFDADVSGQFTKDDLTVWNLSSSTEPTLDRANLALANTTQNTWALSFPGYTYAAVPDGNYETIIEKPDLAGTPDGHVLPFWFYSADFNRDRKVDIGDFSILSSNLHTNQTYSGGDTTYDGLVNFDDFSIMAAKFNMSLNPPPTELNDLSLCGMADPVTLDPFIRLTWTAPAPSDPPRLGYRIWRSTDGVNFGSVDAQINDPNATSFDDTQVSEGTHYWYRVRPFSDAGNAHTTPKRDMITPLRPVTGLSAAPASPTSVDLAWINTSQAATAFVIERSDDGGVNFLTLPVQPAGSPFRDTALSAGATYLYRVAATNAAMTSMPTLSAVVTTPPTGLFTAAMVATGADSIELTWASVSGATRYEVEYSLDGITFESEPVGTFASGNDATFIAFDSGARAYARVAAYDGTNLIGRSNVAGATSLVGNPSKPGLVSAVTGAGTGDDIYVTWAEAGGAADFFIIQRQVNGGSFQQVAQASHESSSFLDTTVAPGNTYGYRVQARNASGASPFSDVAIAGPAEGKEDTDPVAQSFLITFFGADAFSASIDGNIVFLEKHIQEHLVNTFGYNPLNANNRPYRDNEGPRAFRELLSRMDQDESGVVEADEVAATTIRLLGWSLGAVEAAIFSVQGTDTKGFAGSSPVWETEYKLEVPLQIHTLVALDPVTDGIARTLRTQRRPIQSNVANLRNYYQRRGGVSTLHLWQLGTFGQLGFTHVHAPAYASNVLGIDLLGRRLQVGAMINEEQLQLNTSLQHINLRRVQRTDFEDPGNPLFGAWDGELFGHEANHSTLVWYMRTETIAALS